MDKYTDRLRRMNEIKSAKAEERRQEILKNKKCETCGGPIDVWKGRTEPNQIHKRKYCLACGKAKRVKVSRHARMEKIYHKGYVYIWDGDKKVLEHVMVAEKALGRKLKKDEVVHHINGRKDDNRNSNLLVCTKTYHSWLHQEMSRRYMEEHFGHL